MHDIPDTDEADAAAERYFPEEYKKVIRGGLNRSFAAALLKEEAFAGVYERSFREKFADYREFIGRLAAIVVIGAENGVEEVLEEVQAALAQGRALPEKRFYAVYFRPEPFDDDLKKILHQEAALEFRNYHPYEHIYEDHYQNDLSYDDFIDRLAGLVVNGAVNGADKAIGAVYRAFLLAAPLPTVRRRPRRLR